MLPMLKLPVPFLLRTPSIQRRGDRSQKLYGYRRVALWSEVQWDCVGRDGAGSVDAVLGGAAPDGAVPNGAVLGGAVLGDAVQDDAVLGDAVPGCVVCFGSFVSSRLRFVCKEMAFCLVESSLSLKRRRGVAGTVKIFFVVDNFSSLSGLSENFC